MSDHQNAFQIETAKGWRHDVTCPICGVTYSTMRVGETAHPHCLRAVARKARDELCAEYSAKHFGALCPQLTEEYIYDALVRALNTYQED